MPPPRYQDGTVEHNARRKWLRFIARPRFLPLYGDDEEFLMAPVEGGTAAVPRWAGVVKDILARKAEREVELQAAEAVTVNGESIVEQGMSALLRSLTMFPRMGRCVPPPRALPPPQRASWTFALLSGKRRTGKWRNSRR